VIRIGSLFSGYGGLDLAVQSVLGGEIAWHSDIDPAASTILAARFPESPNIGDLTRYGGCGCDATVPWNHLPPVDVLTGGYPCQPFSSAGLRKGTDDERHLWPHVLCAIRELEPKLVVLENVRGHLTLGFADVLADLAQLGWFARWGIVRASDAGAPHQRARLFIVAYPAHLGHQWIGQARRRRPGPTDSGDDAAHPNSNGSRWMPTGLHAGQPQQATTRNSQMAWGIYGPAIARWETVTGRQAPMPTAPGRDGTPRLSAQFTEWMMGLPDGWVTDPALGLSRNQQIRALGNGVVPQQAALALDVLLQGATDDLRQTFATV
jgi:DNA (cytosine-5)-methyltransferase 1